MEAGPSSLSLPPPEATTLSPEREANKLKFELELEMLHALSNPHYLLELSNTGHLESEAFLNFIRYLEYWERKEFVRFVIYPHALHHRRLLLLEPFRQALRTNGQEVVGKLAEGQFQHWRSWRSEKTKVVATSTEGGGTEGTGEGVAV
ncbi:SOH1-domain-containing protein [Mrakia frigida]|uniref:mediator complex subunit SOH1 n=1 Tax=Mrakia frigida TaxID=29902 RepID=UPI003FCBFC10